MRLLVLVLAAGLALAVAGCGGDEPEDDFPPTDPGAVPPGGFEIDEVAIRLVEEGDSGLRGTVVLSPVDATTTEVEVQLFGEDAEAEWQAAIVEGACGEPGEPVHELEPVAEGRSQTQVDASLEELIAGRHAVVAFDPDGEPAACGDLDPAGAETDDDA